MDEGDHPHRDAAPGGPLAAHRLRDDPVSAAAHQRIRLGGRDLFAVSDGFFLPSREAIGTPEEPTAAYDALAREYDEVRMPLGCFFWPGEQNVLIDTGFGASDLRGFLVGGNLVHQLDRLGVRPADIDVIALSHLHGDHAGGLADPDGAAPIFENAVVHVGRGDWEYFVEDEAARMPMAPYVLEALTALAARGQVRLVDGDAQIAPGVERLDAPGHTPGHSLYVVHDEGERILLFGDAMYCPQQLTNLEWGAAFDVDPALARATRERYERDLELHGGGALGCHFPGLVAGRALSSPAGG